VKVGDLVKYRKDEYVTTWVHENLTGLVIMVDHNRYFGDRPICVRWNTNHCKKLWHHVESLEIIK